VSLYSRRESLYFVFLNFPMVQLFFPLFFGPALVIYQVISSFNTLSKVNQTYHLILKSNSFGLKWIHTDDCDNWFKFMQLFLFHLSSFYWEQTNWLHLHKDIDLYLWWVAQFGTDPKQFMQTVCVLSRTAIQYTNFDRDYLLSIVYDSTQELFSQ